MDDELYDPEITDSKAVKGDNPTPKEIRERCLEVQKTWDEETRLSRIADHSMHPEYLQRWEVPMVRISDLEMDPESALGPIIDTDRDYIQTKPKNDV